MKILICLLIYMSVSGSVFFLGYLLLDFLTHEMLPASFRYFLLTGRFVFSGSISVS